MIPAPLILRATPAELAQATREGAVVFARYAERGRGSRYQTSARRAALGFLGEIVAARALGRPRLIDPTDPKAYRDGGADLAGGVEVRTVEDVLPGRPEGWANVCITLYERDRRRLERAYLLVTVLDDVVKLRGWERGRELLSPAPVDVKRRDGGTYVVIGEGFPDQLRDPRELIRSEVHA